MAAGLASSSAGSTASGSSRVKWLTDLEKSVIVSNFEKRGWVRGSLEGTTRLRMRRISTITVFSADGDWNFYFCSVYTARSLFNVDSGFRLADDQ